MAEIQISRAGWVRILGEGVHDGWGVSAELNELFGKYHKYFWRCPRLIELIVEKCELIFRSPCFKLPLMQIHFQESGPSIEVDGENGCLVYPFQDSRYADHNVDTSMQAFCLYLCLQSALVVIDDLTGIWEERGGPEASELSDNCQHSFRFEKDTSKFALYKVEINYDDESLDQTLYAWTKEPYKVRDELESQLGLFQGMVSYPQEKEDGPPMILVEKSK